MIPMQRKIVVPLDGSALAEMVLPQAKMLARATRSTLVLLRVAPTPIITDPLIAGTPAFPTAASHLEANTALAETYLAEVAKRLAAEGLTVQPVLREGDPAT